MYMNIKTIYIYIVFIYVLNYSLGFKIKHIYLTSINVWIIPQTYIYYNNVKNVYLTLYWDLFSLIIIYLF